MKPFLSASATALVLAGAIAGPAIAQEEGQESELRVQKVTVTAQKVEEDLQDVPVSVTAFSGDALEATGAPNIEQITQIVPSLNYRKGTTSANSALLLRGVGTISFSIAAEPSVSTVVDGVVLSRSGQAFADLYDVERMEVLRGPQGTLFGKNASAGVVSIVTKGGADEFEGNLSVGAFEGSEFRFKGSVAGPLTDKVSARLTGFAGSYDGNITNIFAGNENKINGYERQGARLVFDVEASENADFRFAADYAKSDDDCCAQVTIVSTGPNGDALLGFDNTTLGFDTRTVNHDLTTRTEDQTYGFSAQGDFSLFDGYEFTAIAAYRNWENIETREGDFRSGIFVNAAQPGQPGFFNLFQLHDLGIVETDQYSLEARLASPRGKFLEYLVGGYWWHSDNTQQFTRESIQCGSSNLPVDPVVGLSPCDLNDTVNTSFPTATSFSDVDQDNYALFGQATANFSDRFRVIAGLRLTNDEVSFTHERAPGVDAVTGAPAAGRGVNPNPAGGLVANGGNGTNISAGSTDNTNVSGRLVGQFDLSDDANVYASYTRGYKGPAFNVFFNHTNPNNASVIDEETSDAFELGFKSELADGRVVLNGAAFYAEYEGFQANNFVTLADQTVVTNLTNAGTVSTQGFELDFAAVPSANWTLSGGIAYADAKVEEFNPNPLTNAPDARNGTRLPLAPEWSASVVSEWVFPIDSLGMDAILRTDYSYQGEQFSDLGEGGPLPERELFNASLGFANKDDTRRLTFHVRNIFDESYIDFNNQNGRRVNVPRDADRYFGVTFSTDLN